MEASSWSSGPGRLAGKVVVVTGAAGGLGSALAVAVAREGALVVGVDLDGPRLAALGDRLSGFGAQHRCFQVDLTVDEQVDGLVSTVVESFGRVDVLFSNAGGARHVPFLDLSPAEWRRTVELNLTSGFLIGQACAHAMVKAGGGSIVFTTSQLAFVGRSGLAHYVSAKGALTQLVRAMSLELAPYGVRVNAVAPGPVVHDGNRAELSRPENAERHRATIPLGRPAAAEEITGAAVYLASDEASFSTGSTIVVDGGYTAV
jgi:NAD(P)-dependent dehydrogenase (short-subunit alcohol dehydrogenase family)